MRAHQGRGRGCTNVRHLRTVRDIDSEVDIGPDQGLGEHCIINCDNIVTIPMRSLDRDPTGQLDELKQAELDRALRYALDIRY